MTRRSLFVSCFSAFATLTMAANLHPLAAQVIYNPASIVSSSDGTYITDKANNLDWYRFDNLENTVGRSFAEVVASPLFSGWSAATLDQVQSLQAQFGWMSDTPFEGYNSNIGLTNAMANYLGYTFNFFQPDDDSRIDAIQAMTSDAYFLDGEHYRGVTTSRFFRYTVSGESIVTGDYVQGLMSTLPRVTDVDIGTGTWLTRESKPSLPCGGAGAAVDCPVSVVPEPTAAVLLAVGVLGLALTPARRYFAPRRTTTVR